MVLVAEHQKLRATIKSSLSMAISMVKSLMVSWMPKASHFLPNNFSIHLTQATQVALVKGQAHWGFVRHRFNQSNPCNKGVRQWSLKRLMMDDGTATLKSGPKI
ncbi:hypothetical protein ACFXTI_032438 [Malus domestica]